MIFLIETKCQNIGILHYKHIHTILYFPNYKQGVVKNLQNIGCFYLTLSLDFQYKNEKQVLAN